jgi:hypothetical protein
MRTTRAIFIAMFMLFIRWSFWFLEIRSLENILSTGVAAHGIYLLSQIILIKSIKCIRDDDLGLY